MRWLNGMKVNKTDSEATVCDVVGYGNALEKKHVG